MERLSKIDILLSIGGIIALIISFIFPDVKFSAIVGMSTAFIIVYIDYQINKIKEYTKQVALNKLEIKKINERINIYERLSKVEAKLELNKK